jgi:hypothetical protein
LLLSQSKQRILEMSMRRQKELLKLQNTGAKASQIASLEEGPSLSSLSLLSPSSDSQNDNTGDNFPNQDGGIRQSGRVRQPTRAVQSQMSQDAAAQQEKEQKRLRKGKDKRKDKVKQKRNEKLKNTSQLIEDYCIDSE